MFVNGAILHEEYLSNSLMYNTFVLYLKRKYECKDFLLVNYGISAFTDLQDYKHRCKLVVSYLPKLPCAICDYEA